MKQVMVIGTVAILLLSLMIGCAERTTSPAVPVAAPTIATQSPVSEGKAQWEVRWSKVVGDAKKEGEVMIFAAIGAATAAKLTSAFKDKHGIQLNFVTMGTGTQMAEKITRERRAGLFTVDVLLAGTGSFTSIMKPAGLLDKIDPVLILPEVKDSGAWMNANPYTDKERTILPLISTLLRYVTRNTELVKEGEIKSFRDLLDPKWRGRMILNDPTISGAGNSWVSLMAHRWGTEQTRDYLKEFVKQELTITRDGRIQIEAIAHGKFPIGVATRVEVTNEFLNLGAPIAPVRTIEGGTITGSGGVLALPFNRPHPNGAALLANWLLTKEGQSIFSKAFGSPPARLDVPPPPDFNRVLLPEPGEPVQIEDEESLKIKGGPLLTITKEIFAGSAR